MIPMIRTCLAAALLATPAPALAQDAAEEYQQLLRARLAGDAVDEDRLAALAEELKRTERRLPYGIVRDLEPLDEPVVVERMEPIGFKCISRRTEAGRPLPVRRNEPLISTTSLDDTRQDQRVVTVTMSDLHDDSGDYVQLSAVEAGDDLRLMALTNRQGGNQFDFERQPDNSFREQSTGEIYPAPSPTARAINALGEGILIEYPNILGGPRTLSLGDPFVAEGYARSLETVMGEMVSTLGGPSATLTLEFGELILTGTTAVEGQAALVFQGSARATAVLPTTEAVLTMEVSKVKDIATGIVVRERIERQYAFEGRRVTSTDRRECEEWDRGQLGDDHE
ncbi:MAG: hypothetical protein AAGF45_10620 [Pseudomonadota bacterium]